MCPLNKNTIITAIRNIPHKSQAPYKSFFFLWWLLSLLCSYYFLKKNERAQTTHISQAPYKSPFHLRWFSLLFVFNEGAQTTHISINKGVLDGKPQRHP